MSNRCLLLLHLPVLSVRSIPSTDIPVVVKMQEISCVFCVILVGVALAGAGFGGDLLPSLDDGTFLW